MSVKHTHDLIALNAWDGAAPLGPAIDPYAGNALTFHFSVRNLSGNANFAIMCAPADPADNTQPDNTQWNVVEMLNEPCDKTSGYQQAEIVLDPGQHNGKVVSVEVPMCPGCKFYRVSLILGPSDTNDEVRVIAEITHLRNGG